MHLESLIITYGYPILFVGVLLEGEAFLILAAYLAHRGYFSLPVVIGLAALASFTMAQIWFVLGDRFGTALLNRRPAWQSRLVRVDTMLQRYGNSLVLGFRALLGLRTLIPVAIGTSAYPARQFTLLNGVGALIWALVIALAGNTIAQGLEVLVTDLRKHELAAVVVIALMGLVWGLIRLYRQPKVPLIKGD
ncbi:DedA family protein [Spirosoma agri]|uniref:DedA family protein n=1 Tax=Spirosoma agri TaxID=1987381 RepID=A0A6M0IS27_9BACT|nr:DedA family protein [Spirosoma agri]NEU70767.1 DedA family protein [Spirosoma agri]